MIKEFFGILQLRRDNLSNYQKIETSYTPKNGEVLLIDTPKNGLLAKVGNGKTLLKDLPYSFGEKQIIFGYYYNNKFYYDLEHLEEITPQADKLFIDSSKSKIFIFNNNIFEQLNNLPTATSDIAGMVKLYPTTGYNTDGTMTQKAITEALDDKITASVDISDECIILI